MVQVCEEALQINSKSVKAGSDVLWDSGFKWGKILTETMVVFFHETIGKSVNIL
jgi:hypothetical protein